MTEQGLKRLVGALAVLGGLWLVTALLSGRGGGGIAASGEVAEIFERLDGPALVRVVVERPTDTLVLARDGDEWTADGYRTDALAVSTFLASVTSASVGDLMASNPGNHARMGLSDDGATTATFETADGRFTLLFGADGRAFRTAYVRAPGDDAVYLLHGDLATQLRHPLSSWRDRTIVSVDTAEVARVVVEHPEGGYTLVRADSTWHLEGGASASPAAASALLTELSSLEATGFLSETDSLAGLAPWATTRAFDGTGAPMAEVTIGSGDADRWARRVGSDELYRLSSFRAGRMAPARTEVAPIGS